MEQWRVISEFPTHEISSEGRIRKAVDTWRSPAGTVLSVHVARYRSAHIWADGRLHTRMISRLMLEAFVGPPPSPIHQAAHNDGNPHNDVLGNLRWATPKENCADRVVHGTLRYGSRHARTKTSVETVRRARELVKSGLTYTQTARALGLTAGHVQLIATNQVWKREE